MSPLGEESTLRKVSGGSEGYGSEEGLQVVESLNNEHITDPEGSGETYKIVCLGLSPK